MSLSVGIIGLPNAGKSTVFNALAKNQNAQCASYPFCTIEPNRAVVPVRDKRVDRVAELVKPEKSAYATIDFIDIAGLVQGASNGEGLGNQFLSQIRECDALLHIVRCFEDENVAHVCGKIDPIQDMEIINTELLLSDVQVLEKSVSSISKRIRNNPDLKPVLDIANALLDHLNQGEPASAFPKRDFEKARILRHETPLLTDKPTIYCANIGEDSIGTQNPCAEQVEEYAAARNAQAETFCGSVESELAGLSDEERESFLDLYNLDDSALDETIRKVYRSLGLCSFISAKPKEVRAWTIPVGCKAPQAAGKIHSDFERGFIRANVVKFEDFDSCGSIAAAREAGLLHIEGKDYSVEDGDVIEFLFNV